MMHAVAASKKRKEAPIRSTMGMMGAPSEPSDDEDDTTSSSSAPRMPKIRVGNRNLTMHSDLIEMRDSTAEFRSGDFATLRQRLDIDGFIFIRGVMQRETVEKARMKMLKHLHSKGAIREGTDWRDAFIEYQTKFDEKSKSKPKKAAKATAATASSKKMIPGWTIDAETGGVVGGREPDSAIKGWFDVGNSKELADVYKGSALRSFYTSLFSQSPSYAARPEMAKLGLPPFTFLSSCTWLRAKGPGEVTAEHADYYYFYKNTHIFRDFWKEDTELDKLIATNTKSQSVQPKPQCKVQTEEERQTCQVCRDPREPESTLICDLCDHGYHINCLSPRLSQLPDDEQEWHCYSCQNKSMEYWTCWTPLADISGHDGRLALVAGSHRVDGYEAPAREDLLPKGYSKSFESRSIWQTPTTIGMGDIILFNIKTIHAATKNAGEKFRLSLDTRVTTCFGQQYCDDNNIDAVPHVNCADINTLKPLGMDQLQANDKVEIIKNEVELVTDLKVKSSAAAKPKDGKVTSFFSAQKKQKV